MRKYFYLLKFPSLKLIERAILMREESLNLSLEIILPLTGFCRVHFPYLSGIIHSEYMCGYFPVLLPQFTAFYCLSWQSQ